MPGKNPCMVFALFWICSFLLNLHAYLYKGLYYSAPGVICIFFPIHLIFIHKHANDFPGSALSKHLMKTSDYCSGSYCSNDSSTALMLSFCLGENWEQQKVAPLKFFFPVEWFHLRWEQVPKKHERMASCWCVGRRWGWRSCSHQQVRLEQVQQACGTGTLCQHQSWGHAAMSISVLGRPLNMFL